MPRYLTPATSGKVAVAICGRCQLKMHYTDLMADRNVPGLYVCKDCCDGKDPYKLAPKPPENISLHHPRPDEPLI